ncbi:MAG: hypothetical protein MRK02_04315 [Candidatus Scalindua sp.]|nr:hypothetical protein [Candidatus Scalindua sp.]
MRIGLGIYFVVLAFILVFFLFVLWPTKIHDKEGLYKFETLVTLLGTHIKSETRLILIVILVGALRSYVHTVTSFVTYIGNRNLSKMRRPSEFVVQVYCREKHL